MLRNMDGDGAIQKRLGHDKETVEAPCSGGPHAAQKRPGAVQQRLTHSTVAVPPPLGRRTKGRCAVHVPLQRSTKAAGVPHYIGRGRCATSRSTASAFRTI